MWPEIEIAKQENKREINLAGAEISERISANNGLVDTNLFDLLQLNLLNISETSLNKLPDDILKLLNLQTLLLFGNELKTLPESIGHLDKLKTLDVSRNKLEKLPSELSKLINLSALNLSNNLLIKFNIPDVENNLLKLTTINLSNNKLDEFPNICHEHFTNLLEINLKGNCINVIPFEIINLTNLKCFNISSNQLVNIPKSLAGISKLKDLALDDNPISDKRLLKLIKQCHTKQILDYVKQNGVDTPKTNNIEITSDKLNKGVAKKRQQKSKLKCEDDLPMHRIDVKRHQSNTLKLIYMNNVREIRQFILCCIVRNINLSDNKNLKKFLQIQTKLHDSICDKREKSTIATHDLLKIQGDFIRYTTKAPDKLEIVPLGKTRSMVAQQLFNNLKNEAETLRKEKKRNVYSGIHKYLYLLENKELFAYLEDARGNVLSLPPLTNCDLTKITTDTKDVLIEVTSTHSINECRLAIEELIKEILIAGFGNNNNNSVNEKNGDANESIPKINSENDEQQNQESFAGNLLILQQIKIVDVEGNLRTVYPSKTDLYYDEKLSITVHRE